MPFHPQALSHAALKSIVKAMSKAAPTVLGRPMPLHQSRELLARGLGYAHWHEAQEKALSNEKPPEHPIPFVGSMPVMSEGGDWRFGFEDYRMPYEMVALNERPVDRAQTHRIVLDLEDIQKRPGMYYGDPKSPNRLAHALIANAIEEVASGFGDRVTVQTHANGSVTVIDNGRGLPMGDRPDDVEGSSWIEKLLTTRQYRPLLHKKPGPGLVRINGLSLVTALSARLDITVWQAGMAYTLRYERGVLTHPLTGRPMAPEDRNQGTRIQMWPDMTIFENPVDGKSLKLYLWLQACVHRSVQLRYQPHGEPAEAWPRSWRAWSVLMPQFARHWRSLEPLATLGPLIDLAAPARRAAEAQDEELLDAYRQLDPAQMELLGF